MPLKCQTETMTELPATRRSPRLRRVSVSAGVAAGIMVGSLALIPGGSWATMPGQASPAAAEVSSQSTVDWRACPSEDQPGKQCATVKVPKVYGKSGGATIRIALARIPATGTADQRIGSLFWDAGGPGGPSTDMIDSISARMSPAVRKRFDFVAFDPRGIGSSTPGLGSCDGPWPIRPPSTSTPNWATVQKKSAADLADANRACAGGARNIAQHMGTGNVVRDLERLRRAVGDRKLTFWGTSYGTRIGYVYALKYPDRVRALVLDGNIDPSSNYIGLPEVGGTAQDLALQFIRNHDRPAYDAVVNTAADLADDPVPLDGGEVYSRWDWLDFAGNFVAFQNNWSALPEAASIVGVARSADEQAELARRRLAAWKAMPNSNEGGGFSVVNCLDYDQRLTAQQETRVARENAREYPVFGGSLSIMYGIGCRGLGSLDADPIPLVTTNKQRDKLADVPVFLANATKDGSTPLAWAKSMKAAFDRPLLKYRSSQHVIWGATPSDCVNSPIDRFVIDGKELRQGRTCPFVPSAPATTASALSLLSWDRLH